MKEVWKDIAGYEGLYQVSNRGRVRSLARVVPHSTGGKLTVSPKILIPKDRNGYDHVSLWKNNKEYRVKVHRLVAQVFIPNPENKPEVNHIDANPKNNVVENLEWVTRRENMRHAINLGLVSHPVGEYLPYSKLTESDVVKMRKLRNSGMGYQDIAKLFNVNTRTTRAACIGFTWKHVDYPPCEFRTYK